MHHLAPIILAAGRSARMGRPKLFLPLGGRSLLQLAVDAVADLCAGCRPVVVSGCHDRNIREHLAGDDRVVIVHNPEWATGMSSSIAVGVAAASITSPSHYLITLADQPSLGVESLAYLADESLRYPEQIVATQYPERLGVPAIFPIRFAPDLIRLEGPFGARTLLQREETNVRPIAFRQPPTDIDTPEDYLAAGGDPAALL